MRARPQPATSTSVPRFSVSAHARAATGRRLEQLRLRTSGGPRGPTSEGENRARLFAIFAVSATRSS
eukprot:5772327-Alexandrium_andersonii.AAC.1